MLDRRRRKQKKPSIDRARGKRTSIGENVRGETCRRDSQREEEGKKGGKKKEKRKEKKRDAKRDARPWCGWQLRYRTGRDRRKSLPGRITRFHHELPLSELEERSKENAVNASKASTTAVSFSNFWMNRRSIPLHFLIKIFFFELERIHRSISIKLLSLHEPSNFAHVNY